jgi:PilZ domain-containing protein
MRGTRSLACTILNKSHGGALIQVERAADVPDDFYLTFDDEPSRKIVCSVIRRSKQLLAVRYTQQTNIEIRVLRLTTS